MTATADNRGRILYIDLIKCFAIFFVLWGHAITQLMDHPLESDRVYIAIYAFHMPLFMTVSGFFAGASMNMKPVPLAVKKAKQLIIPALAFGVLWYAHDAAVGRRELSLKAFLYLEAECFWFLKCLFFAYIILWIVNKTGRFKPAAMLAACIGFALLQVCNVSFFKMGTMLPFFFLGVLIKDKLEWICKKKEIVGLCSLALFAAGLPGFQLDYIFSAKFFHEPSLPALGHYAYCLMMGAAGSMSIICISAWISEKILMGGGKFLYHIGQNTLGIYLVQKILLELLLPHVLKVDMNLWAFDLLFTPTVSVAMLIVCQGVTLLLDKNRITRQIFLGKYARPKNAA